MLEHWIWLTTRRGLGEGAVTRLLEAFGAAEEVYEATRAQRQLAGLSSRECDALENMDLTPATEVLATCLENGIHLLTRNDANYPERLRNIESPPALLYYKGTLPEIDTEIAVAVVGTRKATPYGMTTAKQLGRQIALRGGMIVSGLAQGIDVMALSGALETDRPVVSVLGCGVDVVYPAQNRSIYEEVLYRGCLLSPFPPGTPAFGGNFPARNRILSGLCLGVVVVEAPEKSGALITARHALEQGRDVFAVPGAVGVAACVGSNRLLQQGAILVSSGEDVIAEYAARFPERAAAGGRLLDAKLLGKPAAAAQEIQPSAIPVVASPAAPVTKTEKKSIDNPQPSVYIDVQEAKRLISPEEGQVLEAVTPEPIAVDDVIERCALPASRVLAALTMLEIRHYIKRLPGKRVQLAGK